MSTAHYLARHAFPQLQPAGPAIVFLAADLAPPAILTYVAAHEVAHLVQMNHSAAYWEVCRRLDPNTDTARKWLKQHGAGLHCYG
jgi:predicted metal-dependent hydrolase